ncbi:6PGL phosphogluconolactonase, partial [Piprites chloris]|nr:6PGL phosphogluconolactonase [Piprites chloris]
PCPPPPQEQTELVAALEDSPKPPRARVTLTLRVLNAARLVLFVAAGASKAAVLKRILEGGGEEDPPLPAALVRPRSGRLRWLLDEAAAAELSIPVEK